jgi:hypothetical protein
VVVCSVTNGNQGHADIEPERLRMIRMAGSEGSAGDRSLYSTLDADDMALDERDAQLRLRLTRCSVP